MSIEKVATNVYHTHLDVFGKRICFEFGFLWLEWEVVDNTPAPSCEDCPF